MDEIDRELTSLLSVEPSPEFRARVRARIATEPAPRPWFFQWRIVGAGIAVAGIAAAVVIDRVAVTEKPRTPAAVAVDRSTPEIPSAVLAPEPPPAIRTAAPARRPVVRVRDAQVIVSPSEVRGLRQLAAIVREGRMGFVFEDERMPLEERRDIEPVKDIVITPIAIAPLDVATHAETEGISGGYEQ